MADIYRYLGQRPHPPRRLLRLLRWYPPFLFQRIVPIAISDDFLQIHVKVKKSILNRNLNGTFFGGTILSAVDPWYGILIWQKALHEGIPIEVWVEHVETRFMRASWGDLYITFHITPEQWNEIRQQLLNEGKLRYGFSFQVYGSEGYLCAEGSQALYLRNLAVRPRRAVPAH